ncbi:MAG: restriction endonuclease subunit S [Bacteroidetes bacterium GWA2_31_9]|nr:MAG: restriction endonuclease subunit S [Bacteroidetes bacterium GWA2_31_9]
MSYKNLVQKLGFKPKENTSGIFQKKYSNLGDYCIDVDFDKNIFHFGGKIKIHEKDFQNITKPEDWVVLECVNRLLEKGYKPENISLEKVYPAGHGFSGRLDICVTRDDGSEYLLIECKTFGKEFDVAFKKLQKDGGQLFTYFKFSNKADVIMLYASELNKNEIAYKNEIVKIETDYRAGDVKDFYEKWSKLTKDNGIFDVWVKPYDFESKALTINDLEEIKQEDSSFIFNRFLEILRHNVVSDKGNAFNRIFTLFLCKIYDEKINEGTNNELGFQWLETDDHRKFQLRLTDLYKNGMHEFLEKVVTDFSETEFKNKFPFLTEEQRNPILNEFRKIRLEKNNEFAIKDVYDEQSFNENAVVVKEIVELLQKFKLRYTKKQQYLSDFFELLLTTGLKQESGQFFTPVPVAQFVIKSLPIDSILEEKLSSAKIDNDTLLPYVMDYAAGSGHFLTETMHEMQRLIKQKDDKKYNPSVAKKIRNWQDDHFAWAIQYIYGIEKDYRLVKVGKVGCYLHGDGLANVIHSDGLARFTHPDYKGKLLLTDKDFAKENKQFDIIVSNPPYSVSAFKNTARAFYKDEDFELYNSLTDNSSEIECLFIERTKQLLKDGGVAGIILPSSILSNTGIYTKSREIILKYFDIVAITELGSNTFMATGTNTVVLFLRRRNNYESSNLKISVDKFFTNLQDVTINGIEKPVKKYVNHVWEGVSFDDYITLLQNTPNKTITEHEIFVEYRKKIKANNEKVFWDILLEKENEKLYYFIIVYPQKVVLVKSGEKDAEKRFLGYEFSNRRGSEGIHPIQRGKNIEDCTQLFDAETFENPEKASTYIYKAFNGDFDFEINETLKQNISRHNLVDMLTFDRVDFEKNISLSVKKKVKIESKWEIVNLGDVCLKITDGSHNPPKGISSGYPMLSSRNVINNTLTLDDVRYISEKDFISENKRTQLKAGDVLLTIVGAIGRVVIVPDNFPAFTLQRSVAVLKCDFQKITNKYLKCVLNYNSIQRIIEETAHGVAQKGIYLNDLKNLQIPLPSKEIQEKIVSEIEILETNEKNAKEKVNKLKNELNTQFNKINNFGKVSLFSISENLDALRKPVTKGYRENGNIPYYGASGIVDYVSDYLLDDYVLLISEDGANLKARTSPIAFTAEGKIWVNNHAHILKFKEKSTHKLVEVYINKTDISEYITGQAQPKLNQQNLNNIKIPFPPISEQQKIVSEIEKIEEKIAVLEKEIAEIPKLKELVLKKYL